jgi:hypothetical protein
MRSLTAMRHVLATASTVLAVTAASVVLAAPAQAFDPPHIVSIEVAPGPFDVTDGPVTVDVTVTLGGEGVESASLQPYLGLTSTTSTQRISTYPGGNQTPSTVRYHVPFAQGAAPGAWTMAFGPVFATNGWAPLDLPPGQPSEIEIVSRDADVAAPALESLTLDTTRVGTFYGVGLVRFNAHVVDPSDTVGFSFRATPPDGGDPVYASMVRISGTPADGAYEAWMHFPQGAPAGTWPLTYVAVDRLGNDVDGPMPAGYPTALVVHHDPVPPSPPNEVSARGGQGTITVTWSDSPNAGGSPVTGFVATLLPERRSLPVGADIRTATFDGLGDGEQHTVVVAAVNAVGTGPEGAPSAPTYTWQVPNAPTGVKAVAGDGSAVVTWAPSQWNGTTVTSYRVTGQPGDLTATVAVPVLAPFTPSATFTGLTNRTAYTFTVAATNAAGTGAESAPSLPATPYAKPSPPVVTSATPAGTGSMQVTWAAPPETGTPVTGYRVTVVDVSAGRVITSPTVGGSSTETTISGLLSGREYKFFVSARNSSGSSLNSAGLLATTSSNGGDFFTAFRPVRALDTRTGTGVKAGKVGPGGSVTFGIPGLPAGARSVGLNLTVTDASASTYITAYAAGSVRPLASNLTVTPGDTRATFVMVPVSADGKVTLYNNRGTVSLLADVSGSFSPGVGSGLVGQAPTRVLDTRTGLGAPAKAKVGPGQELVLRFPGLPTTATAVVLNVTATDPSARTYLTVFPGDVARPNASNLNVGAGQTTANLVTVGLAPDHTIKISNANGTVDLVADLTGYYDAVAGDGYVSRAPLRALDTRTGTGAVQGRVGVTPLRLQVPGLPSGAKEVALSVMAVNPSRAGHLTVYPGGSAKPTASTLNFVTGQTVSNLVVVPVGPDGSVLLALSTGTADLVADLAGVFVP